MSTSFGIVSGVADCLAVKSDASAAPGVSAVTDRVSPGFFRTASIPLPQGREFTWNEVSSDSSVAIVSRSLAGRLFPDGEAVGRTLKVGAREQVFSVGLGAPAALAGAHAARALVADIPVDTPIVLTFTAIGIAGVATLVSAWPAQRAARTPVMHALRAE